MLAFLLLMFASLLSPPATAKAIEPVVVNDRKPATCCDDALEDQFLEGAQLLLFDDRSLVAGFRPVSLARLTDALANLRSALFGDPTSDRPHRYSVSVKLSAPEKAGALPRIYGPKDSSLPLVVIDAGHGGHDPGAVNAELEKREKDVTLAIARKVKDRLEATGRLRVALTREKDEFIVLQDRYAIARQLGADLFISIHADSAENPDAHGATVFTLSEVASDREARKLAARENKANIINGVDLGGAQRDVSSILIDLTQRETMNESADFAKTLVREAGKSLSLRSESHKFASLIVLKAPDTPSVLFESGFISNDKDAAYLTSATGQNRVADSVARAVEAHFARRLTLSNERDRS